ncbi:C45 family autoproteolytic acyltransferase/hydolase [Rhizobium terrae]|uniref:C45 family autoproteolytic acyltransferase/hydolase n=1 Tax=Rhizobium terrae TaxID=2171756 RepID=UPI000E3C3474|nr:C45 family peptidase [Rhizobium terrae]
MTEATAFPFIEIHGLPIERGRMYGEQARERVHKSSELYREQLGRLGYGREKVVGLVENFPPEILDWAPELVEEMRGIAEGAALDFTSVFLINARTELLQLARRGLSFKDEEKDGCTGVVVMPKAARDGKLIHAQNWDWRAECAETSVVVRVLQEDGPDILMFTEAGGLMRSGFNSAGVTITANYLESDRDYKKLGVPLPFIRRKALASQHFAQAIKTVATTVKSGSNNIILSSHEGVAIDFECAPDETFPLYPQNDLIVHANHWQSPVALSKLRETGLPNVPDSLYRDLRVREKLEGRIGALGVEDVKDALFDTFGTPYAVCRPAIRNEVGNLSATVAMIVCQPDKGIMEVAPLPAANRNFTRYKLPMDADKA